MRRIVLSRRVAAIALVASVAATPVLATPDSDEPRTGGMVEAMRPADAAERQVAGRQAVLLARLVKATCFLTADVEADEARAQAQAARAAFETTLARLARTAPVPSTERAASDATAQAISTQRTAWYRFRLGLDRALLTDRPSREMLVGVVALAEPVRASIERLDATLMPVGDAAARPDSAPLFAERLVGRACLAATIGSASERAALDRMLHAVERTLGPRAAGGLSIGDWGPIPSALRRLAARTMGPTDPRAGG